MKFVSHSDDPVNGSDLCDNFFDKNGVIYHKEFKSFFATVNPIMPTPPTSLHLNWKVDPLLKCNESFKRSYNSK